MRIPRKDPPGQSRWVFPFQVFRGEQVVFQALGQIGDRTAKRNFPTEGLQGVWRVVTIEAEVEISTGLEL